MVRSISMRGNKKGFTLIELIVVLAVLAIIMAIAVPSFGGVREDARLDSDMATLASIAKLAEFEYVRQDVDSKENKALADPAIGGVISNNFSEGELFQSKDLKGKKADVVEVSFNEKGKVTTISVDTVDYTYADGKVTPPAP
jgi:prepilin-type N-terminal cleavage/methylation domain-containing protein